MDPRLLFAAMSAAGMGAPLKRFILVADEPTHTRNLFGPLSEIAGKRLEVLDMNPDGDALCIFIGSQGKNIVDVDHRDVVKPTSQPPASTREGGAR